jgi:DNA-directed RNA polymerase subunit omega
MARITVDDCLRFVDNRFHLVLLASERARNLELGASDPLVDPEHDKPAVLALREIAEGLISDQNVKKLVRNPEEIMTHLSEER